MSKKVTGSRNDGEGSRNCSRRSFLKLVGAGGAMALLGANPAQAVDVAGRLGRDDAMGVLVDTTLCVGCRSCEAACNKVNGLPKPERSFDDDSVLEEVRDTSPAAYTVVNKYTVNKGVEITRKQQCMHCVEPACSSACIIKAMEKRIQRCSYISSRPLPGLPLLHGGLPVQRSQVRVFKGVAAHQKVHFLF